MEHSSNSVRVGAATRAHLIATGGRAAIRAVGRFASRVFVRRCPDPTRYPLTIARYSPAIDDAPRARLDTIRRMAGLPPLPPAPIRDGVTVEACEP